MAMTKKNERATASGSMTFRSRLSRAVARVKRFGRALRYVLLAVGLCGAALPAAAAPVLWTLSGATMVGGGATTGSFVDNAGTNTYSAINISVSANGTFGAATFHTLICTGCTGFANSAAFSIGSTGNFGLPALFLTWASALTDAGGAASILLAGSTEPTCVNNACTSVTGPQVLFTGGQITAPSAAPKPASIGVLSLGLGALLMRRRKAA